MQADQAQRLLHTLQTTLAEDARGFTAEPAGAFGIVILNKGHYRGVWHWTGESYSFTPGGYSNSTHSARSPQDVLDFTLNSICRH